MVVGWQAAFIALLVQVLVSTNSFIADYNISSLQVLKPLPAGWASPITRALLTALIRIATKEILEKVPLRLPVSYKATVWD